MYCDHLHFPPPAAPRSAPPSLRTQRHVLALSQKITLQPPKPKSDANQKINNTKNQETKIQQQQKSNHTHTHTQNNQMKHPKWWSVFSVHQLLLGIGSANVYIHFREVLFFHLFLVSFPVLVWDIHYMSSLRNVLFLRCLLCFLHLLIRNRHWIPSNMF